MRKIQRSRLATHIFNTLWRIFSVCCPAATRQLLYLGFKDGAFEASEKLDPVLTCRVFGRTFKTPLGIAVDFDRAEQMIDSLIDMGLGFGEFGPYTLEAEKFLSNTYFLRHKQAIVVSCAGYTNPGLTDMIPFFVSRRRLPSFVGVNIMPSRGAVSHMEQGRTNLSCQDELEIMVQKIAPYCDYIAVNASYPTNELYAVADNIGIMSPMFKTLRETASYIAPYATPKIFLKIPIDLTMDQIDAICQIVLDSGIAGIIISGPHLLSKTTDPKLAHLIGKNPTFLFGLPLKERATQLIKIFYKRIGHKCVIIAVGGISSGRDVYEKMAAGASLVQFNSAFFFKGPRMIRDINRELARLVKEKGYHSVQQIIGTDC